MLYKPAKIDLKVHFDFSTFKQKSANLFLNSNKLVIQTLTQMCILMSLLPSKQVCHGGAQPPLLRLW